MTLNLSRDGYVFLISAIVIGAIGVVSTVSLLVLGWAAEQNGQTIVKSNQALELANTCLDRAILALQENANYRGGDMVDFPYGTCRVYPMEGTGNRRGICVEGQVDGTTRRLQVVLSAIFPSITVRNWDDVSCCTLSTTPGQCDQDEPSSSSSSVPGSSSSSSSRSGSSSSSSAPGSGSSSSSSSAGGSSSSSSSSRSGSSSSSSNSDTGGEFAF